MGDVKEEKKEEEEDKMMLRLEALIDVAVDTASDAVMKTLDEKLEHRHNALL